MPIIFQYEEEQAKDLSKFVKEKEIDTGIVIIEQMVICPKLTILEGQLTYKCEDSEEERTELVKSFLYGKKWSSSFEDLITGFVKNPKTRTSIPQLSYIFKDGDTKKLEIVKDNKIGHQWETKWTDNDNMIVTIYV